MQDARSRWNSVFFMIEKSGGLCVQFFQMSVSLTAVIVILIDLKPEQWDLLQELKNVLHPLLNT